ncbi:hypothetical protein TraAM80_07692 [Trypanosoma rangeli]|uniref:Uncharacterized protein n=1 Tax=Trypanosoma rangeli TaxID=5698 RepID=A0A422N4C6_TRYRA|nr:uncharacterized protein TraAM80_07692 [Trypanosoma rangeli]RNF00300.1 hypothetical protein TraAM80_07692 [Trypanosoma rangeli]|eukprot:RNF00300.1 hypothetical protein TraAM80_07692 [Trypanosoma rangeli]
MSGCIKKKTCEVREVVELLHDYGHSSMASWGCDGFYSLQYRLLQRRRKGHSAELAVLLQGLAGFTLVRLHLVAAPMGFLRRRHRPPAVVSSCNDAHAFDMAVL